MNGFIHNGEPKKAILGFCTRIIQSANWRRTRINPEVFFIGPDVVAYLILDAAKLGMWGAQLEGKKPIGPLLGVAFVAHVIVDQVDEENRLVETTRGHSLDLWTVDGHQSWFWEDGKDLAFRPVTNHVSEASFLAWHLERIEGPAPNR